MILYTTEPIERIFPGEEPGELRQMAIAHGFIEAEKSDDGYRLRRLISTLPSDYLNPKYFPGQPVSF